MVVSDVTFLPDLFVAGFFLVENDDAAFRLARLFGAINTQDGG